MEEESGIQVADNKQYGLLIVKPEGVKAGVDAVLSSLLNISTYLEHVGNTNNPIRDWVLANYPSADRPFMLDRLPLLKTELTLFRDTSADNSLWQINYAPHLPNHYHDAVMETVRGENMLFFVSYLGSDYPIEELLKKIKGVTRLIKHNRLLKDGEDSVVRKGFGIRGLQNKIAAILTRSELEDLIIAISRSNLAAHQYLDLVKTLPNEINRTSLPRELQRLIFPYISRSDNYELISDALHSSDNAEIVFSSLVDIIQKTTSNINICKVAQGKLSVHHKIGNLIRAYRLTV